MSAEATCIEAAHRRGRNKTANRRARSRLVQVKAVRERGETQRPTPRVQKEHQGKRGNKQLQREASSKRAGSNR